VPRLRIGFPKFPLSISGRVLVQANGAPFYLHGDTPWSIVPQFTRSQIDAYLADRYARGITCILFNAIEHNYTDQTPAYRAVEGYDPFATATDFAAPNEIYWQKVDYIVNQCRMLGIVCLINPIYAGYLGGSEGWTSEINAETAGDLQTYGAFLANRYRQGNVVWSMGGDYAGDTTFRNKQWNVVTGMRTVRTTDIITAHNSRGDSDAHSAWTGFAGFNLNAAYTTNDLIGECATAYGRGTPFIHLEGVYMNESSATAATVRVQAWQALAAGACGHFYGQRPMWSCGAVNGGGSGAANAISAHLNEAGINALTPLRNFIASWPWWTMEPKTDASLVSSSLGSGIASVNPMRASNGSAAMIHTNVAASITLVMTAFTISQVRVRWLDPSNGNYTPVGQYANTGTQVITHPGVNSAGGNDWVLVCDQPIDILSLGQTGLDCDIDGAGTSPATVSLGTTQASGSTIVVCAGTNRDETGAPTDNKGNTYSALQGSNYYGNQWQPMGIDIWADAQAVGGAGHAISVAKPTYAAGESTIIAVEVQNAGAIQASSIVARQTTGPGGQHVSASVTTTGPAMLISFWGGDGGADQIPLYATPEAGWTKVQEVALDEIFHVQMACAVKYVSGAGTYTCTWTANSNQGGIIALVAVQKA
jgi:hypothetical protein